MPKLNKDRIREKLRQINAERVRKMRLGEMVDIIVLPETWDETFREQVVEKYFEITKN